MMIAFLRLPTLTVLAASMLLAAAPLAADEPQDAGSVSLVVDYGNGARTSFGHVPWFQTMNARDVLELSSGMGPGLKLEALQPTRGDSAFDVDCTGGTWQFWVNERPLGDRLWVRGSKDQDQKVAPGDVVLARRSAPPDDNGSSKLNVSLVIDYSNAVTKSFTNLAWHSEIDVVETLLAAAGQRSGLNVDFAVYPNPNSPNAPMVDRANREIGFVEAIDGMAADAATGWIAWIDSREGSGEIRFRSNFSGGLPRVDPGSVVVVKRVARERDVEGPFHEPSTLLVPREGVAACG